MPDRIFAPASLTIRTSRELNALVEQKQLPIAHTGEGYQLSTVSWKKAAPLVSLVASTAGRITPDQIPAANQELWPKLNEGLKAAGAQARHPCVYFYGESDQRSFVLEIGFPLPSVPDRLTGADA